MPYTVLRTATGSAPAPFVIQALKQIADVRVIAVDSNPLAVGFHFADAHYVVPPVTDPDFLAHMRRICINEHVDLFIPALEEEVAQLAEAIDDFNSIGTVILLPSSASVATCQDKLLTYEFFQQHDIPTPHTSLPADYSHSSEKMYIVKPRSGRGSQNVFKTRNREETAFFSGYVPHAIIQEFIEGTEYSIDTLSDKNGRFLYCAMRERIATESGISYKGRSAKHSVVEAYAQKIADTLKIIGPTCMQCIVSPNGAVYFIEINLRIGGGAALSLAAGVPLVTDLVRLARGQAIEGIHDYREGMVMLRHWSELFSQST